MTTNRIFLEPHRAELAQLFEAALKTKVTPWERYGLILLRGGLTPGADAWTIWRAVTELAAREKEPGLLAACAMAFGAALTGDDGFAGAARIWVKNQLTPTPPPDNTGIFEDFANLGLRRE